MPAHGVKVASYSVQLGQKIGFGSRTHYWTTHAVITCNCESDFRLIIYFLTRDSAIPPAYFEPKADKGGTARIYLPFEHYHSYIDLLRNEAPISAYIWTDKPETCHLYTGIEAPGEGEEITHP